MKKNSKRIESARTWLRLVRAEGDDVGSKREYLREKGFTEGELEELLSWDREDARHPEPPLFG